MSEELPDNDHRVIGKKMSLFAIDPMVGQGLILWLPNGGIIRTELQTFMQEQLTKRGYSPVFTPHIGKIDLYKTSGHFPLYADSQFPTIKVLNPFPTHSGIHSSDVVEDEYILKPMNCPHHCRIFSAEPRSYRDLPLRFSEFGSVYRLESAGSLLGLTRVRGLTQDDAHIFCSHEQVEGEIRDVIRLTKLVLDTMGMKDFRAQVSLRGKGSKYAGDSGTWDKAEDVLRRVAAEMRLNCEEMPGEAAFYGPKIDFIVTDACKRERQLGTVQLDYVLPERFNLQYTGKDGKLHRPVMIHRAPFGSFERFIGLLHGACNQIVFAKQALDGHLSNEAVAALGIRKAPTPSNWCYGGHCDTDA